MVELYSLTDSTAVQPGAAHPVLLSYIPNFRPGAVVICPSSQHPIIMFSKAVLIFLAIGALSVNALTAPVARSPALELESEFPRSFSITRYHHKQTTDYFTLPNFPRHCQYHRDHAWVCYWGLFEGVLWCSASPRACDWAIALPRKDAQEVHAGKGNTQYPAPENYSMHSIALHRSSVHLRRRSLCGLLTMKPTNTTGR